MKEVKIDGKDFRWDQIPIEDAVSSNDTQINFKIQAKNRFIQSTSAHFLNTLLTVEKCRDRVELAVTYAEALWLELEKRDCINY